MAADQFKSQVDRAWNAFWSNGMANPMEVIEEVTYPLFIKGLDEFQTLAENKANTLGTPIANPVFPQGMDDTGRRPRSYSDLRWSHFKNFSSEEMFEVVGQDVFPFIQRLGEEGSSYAAGMKDARFTIPTRELLVKAVDLLEGIPMHDRDTKGDIYEYRLGKLASASTNGQFRTPRHIIKLMVDMTAPTPTDTIIDPAAGTAGSLVMAGEYLRKNHTEIWADAASRDHFNRLASTGFDSDASMSRIGSINRQLHGVETPTVQGRDSLAEEYFVAGGDYTLVLANPPFAGSLDYETTTKDLLQIVKTKKTELLFLALMLRLLKNGGRAALIVPDGVLFGSSRAHKNLRRMLVEDHRLEAVVRLPSGVFKPYAGVSTAILFFQKTSSGSTDNVWFYEVKVDGFSLDDKRSPTEADDLPDVLARWQSLGVAGSEEPARPRTAQSFLVPKAEIAEQGYDLRPNRYREVVHDEVVHPAPADILADLALIEQEIADATAAWQRHWIRRSERCRARGRLHLWQWRNSTAVNAGVFSRRNSMDYRR